MPRELTIGTTRITDESDCYIIAEIGQNHMGSLEVCHQLFEEAQRCGVDAVKLQKRDNRSLYTSAMYNQPYHSEHAFGDTYGSHREALEFGKAEYRELKEHADRLGLDFFATAWDEPSADFLADLDVPAYKLASADLLSTHLIRHVASKGKPLILSTGGATMDDIRRALDAALPINPQVCLLQCTAAYPVQPEDMHLRVIETFRREFPELVIGLSDHQDGISMSVLAYSLGARVFEKHFTKHRSWKGGDQAFSLEPDGMRKMVRDLKRARIALGDPEKKPIEFEVKPLIKMRKKIVADRDLPVGHVVQLGDLAFRSPGDGLPPYEVENIVGRPLAKAVAKDQGLDWSDLA